MMKHHVLVGLAVALCVVAVASALADDLRPPDWRGELNSTLQIWEFGNDDNPALPTVDENPFGTAVATIYGEFDFPNRDTWWIDEDFGHMGVWNIASAISLEIPNDPILRPLKMIRLQIIHDSGISTPEPEPHFTVIPSAGPIVDEPELIEQISLDGVYVHDTYDFVLEPNPDNEVIWIQPRYCNIYIDQIVVDTICIPEPSTLVTLLIGVLACSVCRRRAG